VCVFVITTHETDLTLCGFSSYRSQLYRTVPIQSAARKLTINSNGNKHFVQAHAVFVANKVDMGKISRRILRFRFEDPAFSFSTLIHR
jgi:hypothetical protein